MRLFLYFAFILLTFFCACRKEDTCLQYVQIQGNAFFVHEDDSLVVRDTIMPQPVAIIDTLLFTSGKASNRISFLPNSLQDSSRLVVATDSLNAIWDTVTIHYSRNLRFISKACGFVFNYNINRLTYTKHKLVKAKLNSAAINDNLNARHILLYY